MKRVDLDLIILLLMFLVVVFGIYYDSKVSGSVGLAPSSSDGSDGPYVCPYGWPSRSCAVKITGEGSHPDRLTAERFAFQDCVSKVNGAVGQAQLVRLQECIRQGVSACPSGSCEYGALPPSISNCGDTAPSCIIDYQRQTYECSVSARYSYSDSCKYSPPSERCGNSIREGFEECDPPNTICRDSAGNSGICASNCLCKSCGNQRLEPGEECDPPFSACINSIDGGFGTCTIGCKCPGPLKPLL